MMSIELAINKDLSYLYGTSGITFLVAVKGLELGLFCIIDEKPWS